MKKHRIIELITDPQSDQLSMSRLCLGVIFFVYLPALALLDVVGFKLGIWSHLSVIVGSVAGIYGVNSGLRVWKNRELKGEQ